MLAAARVGLGIVVLAAAMAAGGCDGSGDDDGACRTCATADACDDDQECVPAADGQQRCFELEEATCTVGRVTVARAPTPAPTATP
jgi:hypothetical protein